ncbi:RES family NAD+ phosphorylase [Pseudoalteromonas obscura]|uniref:RES family NAD+ phosphorylase n=1 Tax=Pseudoalteromonas obscura TaxID=3048491 RepID=A0ABT7EK78_9GAMM|nr:RES family NAD+ phosphorylase [Pseudoalteromonas sp. P94(2023)]MDK2595418.1 RES family NAD+ phosphorylase [Pseudoalteromonas sp. P94(2023)]
MLDSKGLLDISVGPISEGYSFFRVFDSRYSATTFPPLGLGDSRFSPLDDRFGSSLYVGDSVSTCLRECVLRFNNGMRVLPNEYLNRQVAQVRLRRNIRVGILDADAILEFFKLKDLEMNLDGDFEYAYYRLYAELLLTKYPEIGGFMYRSFQKSQQSNNLVVYSNRVGADIFEAIPHSQEGLVSEKYASELYMEANSVGIKLPYTVIEMLRVFGLDVAS